MKKLIYKKIDAFTSGLSLGNPAACVYLNENEFLTEEEMQGIAKQNKGFVSEVVFCKSSNDNDFDLVFYSSECEVNFCGHGTIACFYELIKNSPILINQKEITAKTRRKGSITIYNKIPVQDAIFISAPQPVYFPVPVSKDSIAENLSIDISVVSNEYPIDFIEAGNRALIVPINSLENEINIFPNEQRLKKFSLDNGIDVILIFCKDVADGRCFMHTRVFAAKYGYLEDPATGSANSAFGYYLIKNKLWNGEPIKLEQGGKDRIFNTVELYCSDNLVHFGGKASVRIDGFYFI